MAGVAIAQLELAVGSYAKIVRKSTLSVDVNTVVFCGGLQSRLDSRHKNDATDHKQRPLVTSVSIRKYHSYKSRKTRSSNKKARCFIP